MLVEHISSMQGLSDTHKEARAAQVELTYKKILHQLNLLQKVWKVSPLFFVYRRFTGIS
jgi:hypothetical protein